MNWATTTYPPLSKGYFKVSALVNCEMWRSPAMLVPHGTAQQQRNIYCFQKFGQDPLQENQIFPAVQRIGQKAQSNEVVSKNAG
ncbi:hypothetical protein TNCT_676211 [Trichonephila clavata]|uniref:Uncharacterized protein n=1 Tax=Trichonephila clavata TaxID=2740835 RepID=A0A8X6FZC2_TRICU|nr:hypothetical protein TNCT_676211 [Trichonephila clavata]